MTLSVEQSLMDDAGSPAIARTNNTTGSISLRRRGLFSITNRHQKYITHEITTEPGVGTRIPSQAMTQAELDLAIMRNTQPVPTVTSAIPDITWKVKLKHEFELDFDFETPDEFIKGHSQNISKIARNQKIFSITSKAMACFISGFPALMAMK